MQIKICGMTREPDVEAACAVGADFVGLILAESKRRVSAARAAQLARCAGGPTQPVLLFMDQPLDEACAAIEQAGVTWVQLHGGESPEFVRELRQRFPELRVIKAWSVGDLTAGRSLARYLAAARDARAPIDVVIVDAPKGGPHPGFPCLAAVAASVAQETPIWCAGGLTAENLSVAVPAGAFHGVDVARGVETSPGEKDAELIRGFVTAARQILPAEALRRT